MIPASGKIQVMRHFEILGIEKSNCRSHLSLLRCVVWIGPRPNILHGAPIENPTKNHFVARALDCAVISEIGVVAIPGPNEAIEGVRLIADRGMRMRSSEGGDHMPAWVIQNNGVFHLFSFPPFKLNPATSASVSVAAHFPLGARAGSALPIPLDT
jgi:hypothetical protein